ncbi:MAG: substrate-binding domain-containing protein [Polyangiales bacterium]
MPASPPNRVRRLREERGLTQLALAGAASISRQALSAIEAGRTDPSVSLALRLARALECRVEDLFGGVADRGEQLVATIARSAGQQRRGPLPSRVALTFVRERWVAHPLAANEPESIGLAADALTMGRGHTGRDRIRVELLRPLQDAKDTVVLLGCAPALGLLAQRLNGGRGPGRFLWLKRTSAAALDALDSGLAHVAGVHLAEGKGAQANLPAVQRRLPGAQLALVTLAQWEAGLVVRPGNPLGVRDASDLARRGIRIAAREAGAGARRLLEERLRAARVPHKRLLNGALELRGHLEVAQAVATGAADVGLAMQHAAIAYGLDFIALAGERFDLVIPTEVLEDPRIARMLDVMNGGAFRRELGALGGYDASECGSTIADVRAS